MQVSYTAKTAPHECHCMVDPLSKSVSFKHFTQVREKNGVNFTLRFDVPPFVEAILHIWAEIWLLRHKNTTFLLVDYE